MQIHYPDGSPFDPEDVLESFQTRMNAARAFAECFRHYPNADAKEVASDALYALCDDFEEVMEAVGEWFKKDFEEKRDASSQKQLQDLASGARSPIGSPEWARELYEYLNLDILGRKTLEELRLQIDAQLKSREMMRESAAKNDPHNQGGAA